MGQKINPIIYRIPIIDNWRSKWFMSSHKKFSDSLRQDVLIRDWLNKSFRDAGLDRIEIERSPDQLTINIYTSKPGVVIGRGGVGIEKVKKYIKSNILKGTKFGLQINIKELDKPQFSAAVVVSNVVADLEKRLPYRRTIKRALDQVIKAEALGAKIEVKGRLDGREIARKERLQFGSVPLQTIRADISYSHGNAYTTYGVIGVKAWVYRGEIFGNKVEVEKQEKNDEKMNSVNKRRPKK